MGNFLVTTSPVPIFQFGEQTNQTIQNLGPDPVWLDDNTSVAPGRALLVTPLQAVVWSGGRPLFAASSGRSNLFVTTNNDKPSTIIQPYIFYGRGRTSAQGLSFNDSPPSGPASPTFGFSPVLYSGGFQALMFRFRNTRNGVPPLRALQLQIYWLNEADVGALSLNQLTDPGIIRLETNTFTFINDQLLNLWADVIIKVASPAFAFKIVDTVTGADLAIDTIIQVYGMVDEREPQVVIPDSYTGTGTPTIRRYGTDSIEVFHGLAGPVGRMHLPTYKRKMTVILQTNAAVAANTGLVLFMGHDYPGGEPIQFGIIGPVLYTAATAPTQRHQETYSIPVGTYIFADWGALAPAPAVSHTAKFFYHD